MSGPAAVDRVRVGTFEIPTDFPESDGTLAWKATTLVVVELGAGDHLGTGFTYADGAAAKVIAAHAAEVLKERPATDVAALTAGFLAKLRNSGRGGLASSAASAVDIALWDLKGRLLGVSVGRLLGLARDSCPIYGSGGFTSYPDDRLQAQFDGWKRAGIRRFKMKVGREPERDASRVRAARSAIGDDLELFVDANSAYGHREALRWGHRFAAEFGVTWFEEPIAPRDLAGLRFLREHLPPSIEIAEGEYEYDADDFRQLIAARAADVVMADATRCGVTGFLRAAALCEAWHAPLSSHCAPALHAHLGCVAPPFRHAEYFHDHVRIESLLFEGLPALEGGALRPDFDRPGFGWSFRWKEAERYAPH